MKPFLIASICLWLAWENAQAQENALWGDESARSLIAYTGRISEEGLDPARYDTSALVKALQTKDRGAIDAAATELFNRLAHDLSRGTVPPPHRAGWFIDGSPLYESVLTRVLTVAKRAPDVGPVIARLAPPNRRYRKLKEMLAAAGPGDTARRARLQINMERWRWMPRYLGSNYILVNIPAFNLRLVRDGVEVDRRRVIVGALHTPTPVFRAYATGITFNPTWYIPPRIAAEGIAAMLRHDPVAARRKGYYRGGDGNIRQAPGPGNALGQMKLEMPNRFSVYIHDTPSKELFMRENRALSHGCIRTEDALGFAEILLERQWSTKAIGSVTATGNTVMEKFDRPLPVYVTYFTALPNEDGTISYYADIYGRDRQLASQTNIALPLDDIPDDEPGAALEMPCGPI